MDEFYQFVALLLPKKIQYNGSIYQRPSLKWTRFNFVQPQMHPFDNFFYDHRSGNYTVSGWMADLKRRYGGIDSTLVWPSYPSLGIDDRTQFDMVAALPGGLPGVRGL